MQKKKVLIVVDNLKNITANSHIKNNDKFAKKPIAVFSSLSFFIFSQIYIPNAFELKNIKIISNNIFNTVNFYSSICCFCFINTFFNTFTVSLNVSFSNI